MLTVGSGQVLNTRLYDLIVCAVNSSLRFGFGFQLFHITIG